MARKPRKTESKAPPAKMDPQLATLADTPPAGSD